ncbi:MAG TPA: NAD(P)/FAD-dependent oxidoreductase [Syntrophales bacterium]|nr:NAD(P)/FAD-dependent oxidoreductase [Syntrophales bacterium]
MTDARFDITIIGAGIIGLAIAEALSARYDNVLLVEKRGTFGQETSSRNSEVIHAGIYYPPDFLKARFCREGNRDLYEWCREHGISHRRIGKLIVAVTDDEVEELWKIKEQAFRNDVNDLFFLTKEDIADREPYIRVRESLFSPSTGIIDSHALMNSFLIGAQSQGTVVAFNTEITAVHFDGDTYELETNGGEYRFTTNILINSAGLFADSIAALVGIDIDRAGYRLAYCKGNYFSASPSPKLQHLVYPVPPGNKEGLGIHATLDLGGRVRFGPDVEYVNNLDYVVNEDLKDCFHSAIARYLPHVKKESLHPDMCGIRPKLQAPGEEYHDFIIREESGLGYPRLINLLGIESPGLTACIPIARYVSSIVESSRD